MTFLLRCNKNMAAIARRMGARTIQLYLPGSSPNDRQDKQFSKGEEITGERVVEELVAQYDRVITCDMHRPTLAADYPNWTNIHASRALFDVPKEREKFRQFLYEQWGITERNVVPVAPDAGGIARAKFVQTYFEHDKMVCLGKIRNKETGVSRCTGIESGSVKNEFCFLIDDIADSFNTTADTAKMVRKNGPAGLVVFIGHAILSGNAQKILQESITGPNPLIDQVYFTNGVPLPEYLKEEPFASRVVQLDLAPVMADHIVKNLYPVQDSFQF